MTPLMMRIFTLVGIALAAFSMQSKARADGVAQPVVCVIAAGAAASCIHPGRQTS